MASAQFGCAGGALAACPFGLIAGWLTSILINATRGLLESWQRVPVDMGVLGQPWLNVVTLLHLSDWLSRLRFLDSVPWLVTVGVTTAAIVFLGVFGASLAGIGAWLYNSVSAFSGGLAIDLEEA
jgi:hypothetical protein